MLKVVASVLFAFVFLSGCGGSGGGENNPIIKSSVSVSSSSAAVTSSTAMVSSVASSAQSSSSPYLVTLDASKWIRTPGKKADISVNAQGALVLFKEDYDGVQYLYTPTKSLENATIEVTVTVSNEFKVSSSGLQLYAFVTGGEAKGDCPITLTADLVAGSDSTISCVLDFDAFNQTAADVGIGLQNVGGTPGGSVTIKSAVIKLVDPSTVSSSSSSMSSSSSSTSSSSPSQTVIDLPVGTWYEKGSGASVNQGAFTVSSAYTGAGRWLDQPTAQIEGATIEVVVNVNTQYKNSGSGIQLAAFVKSGTNPEPGKNDCAAVPNSALVASQDYTVSCVMNSGGAFSQTATGVEIELWALGSTVSGSFTIKSARIVLP